MSIFGKFLLVFLYIASSWNVFGSESCFRSLAFSTTKWGPKAPRYRGEWTAIYSGVSVHFRPTRSGGILYNPDSDVRIELNEIDLPKLIQVDMTKRNGAISVIRRNQVLTKIENRELFAYLMQFNNSGGLKGYQDSDGILRVIWVPQKPAVYIDVDTVHPKK